MGLAALVRRVNAVLVLVEERLTQPNVVGRSLGAGIVLRLAALSADRVAAICYLDAGAAAANGSAIPSSSLRLVPLIARVSGGSGFSWQRLLRGARQCRALGMAR